MEFAGLVHGRTILAIGVDLSTLSNGGRAFLL